LRTLSRVLITIAIGILPLSAVDWEPISEGQLALEEPRLDPEADSEALFWRVWLTDHLLGGQQPQTIKEQYLRIKIFTERGVENQSTIDLVSVSGQRRIGDLRARTIKPDGRIIDLEKNSVFERTVAKASGYTAKTKAFSMPGVEPGDIIEYQWKETQDNHFAQYSRLSAQLEIPVWEITFFLKPSAYAREYRRMSMMTQSFNVSPSKFEEAYLGFSSTSVRDVPAFKAEPHMPPEDQVRGWILLFYTKGTDVKEDKYWKELGKDYHKVMKLRLNVDGSVKKKVAELTGGLVTPEEKLARIREFCLNEIKNVYDERSGVTAEQRDKFKSNERPGQTLKQGMGTGTDINSLFVAMLTAAGIEARFSFSAGRDDSFFNPSFLDPYLLNRTHVAVKLADEWTFHDLASPYLEPGMLTWPEEGVQSLLVDGKDPMFVQTPYSGPERNRVIRKADLTLLEDGTLEGTVERVYLGHDGAARKEADDGESEEGRRDAWEESVKSRLSTAKVSEIVVENATSIEKPYSVKYHVRVPAALPKENRLDRKVEYTLNDDGSIEGKIHEQAAGSSASENRRLRERLTTPEYRQVIERWVARGVPGASVSTIEAGESEGGGFFLDVSFASERYGRTMGTRLLMFKPAVVSRRSFTHLTDEERENAVVLDADTYSESVTVQLPSSFAIDEMSDPIEVETDFGSYAATWKEEDGKLIFERRMELLNATIEPENYATVKEFFETMIAAEQSPVVLVRR
jgi:hypothetical protein